MTPGTAVMIGIVFVTVSLRCPAQESEATFFDREDFNTCAAYLGADSQARGAYLAWADGYLTARAEDGGLRRFAARDGNEPRFMAWIAEFCRQRPQESFYAAVAALDEALRNGTLHEPR